MKLWIKMAVVFSAMSLLACQSTSPSNLVHGKKDCVNDSAHQTQMLHELKKHLNTVSNKDAEALSETLHPDGIMTWVMPDRENTMGAEAFVEAHKKWFAEPGWTFETKILQARADCHLGNALVEVMYREADRGGKPYFNRMMVSYFLEYVDGTWHVVHDHAGSVEKSDPQ